MAVVISSHLLRKKTVGELNPKAIARWAVCYKVTENLCQWKRAESKVLMCSEVVGAVNEASIKKKTSKSLKMRGIKKHKIVVTDGSVRSLAWITYTFETGDYNKEVVFINNLTEQQSQYLNQTLVFNWRRLWQKPLSKVRTKLISLR